jgi:hypothetical protein
LRRLGNDVLRRGLEDSGTTYVEPVRAGSSVLEAVELSTSYSSEFETVEHHGRKDAADAAMRHGLPVRKSLAGENLMSGSGPSVSARPEGEQPVEGVRNPEDGRCRARQARDVRIPSLMSLERRGTPGGAIRSGMTGEGASARTLRGRRSLRELPGGLRTARTGTMKISHPVRSAVNKHRIDRRNAAMLPRAQTSENRPSGLAPHRAGTPPPRK